MTAVTVALDDIERLVEDVVTGDASEAETLAILRARGLNPDAQVLTDAVTLLWTRNGLIAGSIDPYSYFEAPPRAGVDMWQAAVNDVEAKFAWQLNILARATARRVRSVTA